MDKKYAAKPIRVLIHTKRWYHTLPDLLRYIWRLTRTSKRVVDIGIRMNFTDDYKMGSIVDHYIKEIDTSPQMSCDNCSLYAESEDVCGHEEFDCVTNREHLGVSVPSWCPINELIQSVKEEENQESKNDTI